MTVRTVAMLTAGGLAPCLSSAVGGLIQRYTELAPDVRIIAYTNGYAGLLRGESIEVTPEVREKAHLLHRFGGSPIGNSRVKLTNVADCVKRGLVQEGQDPLHVAAEQLDRRRRRRAAHDRRRRHQHHRRRPRGLPARERLRADRGRPAQDRRQRRRADPPVARRVDRRRAGLDLRPEHHRRAHLEPADAHRPRGHGPQLRVAHRRDRRGVPQLGRRAGVRARHRQRPPPLGRPRGLRARAPASTCTPRPTGCAP